MRMLFLLGAAVLAAGCANQSRDASTYNGAMAAVDELQLADDLSGRVAGEPRNCVRQQDIRNARSAGRNTILFDGPGGIVYVNRASGSCPNITDRDAIRFRTVHTAICSGELIRVFDPQTGVEYGGCSLGQFVPWRRTR